MGRTTDDIRLDKLESKNSIHISHRKHSYSWMKVSLGLFVGTVHFSSEFSVVPLH